VADRLSALDVSFLYLEDRTTPMHVGSVAIFEEPEQGFDYDRLVQLIKHRIAFVPRYRQRVRWVPGKVANPVWVDDEHFDVAYHVRRSALPRPGSDEQLRELVARIMSRHLDRDRPLWEMYLVEGLADNRFAILTKTHHAMVDGLSAVDIGQVILDVTPEPRDTIADVWRPGREPSGLELFVGGVADWVRSPAEGAARVRTGLSDAHDTVRGVGRSIGGVISAVSTVVRPPATTPLNDEIGEQRRFASADTSLADYRRVRKAHGGTVNDVVLAVVAGGLREWLMTRGESLNARSQVRVMVPVSIRESEPAGEATGNAIAAFLCDLPVGEPDPVVRLQRITFEMGQYKATNKMLGAQAIVGLAGFSPPTLHALGARAVSGLSQRVWNTVVTNVPGPQFPLYAGGCRMVAAYPVVALARNQVVSIGLTSYDGGVYYGLLGDRDAMPDVDVLADCIAGALAELVETTTSSGRRRTVRA
jgi:diacylglycerol O-acyltransferase